MRDTITIDYSREASVQINGVWFSAFQRNTYLARVQFPDGFRAVIVLPDGACSNGTAYYLDRVLANAAAMHKSNMSKGFMTEEPSVPLPPAPRAV